MSSAMDTARRLLLEPNELDRRALDRLLSRLASAGPDRCAIEAELFLENSRFRSWRLRDERISGGSAWSGQGMGARSVSAAGDVAFSHTSDLRPQGLAAAVGTVAALRGGGPEPDLATDDVPARRDGGGPLPDRDGEQAPASRLALLRRLGDMARAVDPHVRHVDAMLIELERVVLVARLDGEPLADLRPVRRIVLTVTLEREGRRADGLAAFGGRFGFEAFDQAALLRTVSQALQIARARLDARPAPSGLLPVVLGPGYPGVLFHEAVGHGLEGDHMGRRLSAFHDRLGQRVAPPGVSVIDDGTVPGRTGSGAIDDEGTPTRRNVLIEDGVLVGLMHDRLSARLAGVAPTGNGRRQSWAHAPMPRMTNTMLAPGRDAPEDIVRSVRYGLYAAAFGGGQVDITSGRFNFSATEIYLIEDGRLTAPVEGVTLIGVGHETLRNIRMVGPAPALDDGGASCVKRGQTLDVGVGQPMVRIDDMMIGGGA